MDASISLTTYPIWAILPKIRLIAVCLLISREGWIRFRGRPAAPPRRCRGARRLRRRRQLPADPDRPDDVVVADKHPAGDRHQLAGGQSDRGVDELGAGLGSGGQASAAD